MNIQKENIKAIVSYDGTNYNGFQAQKNGLGIETVICDVLTKVHGFETSIICAGRTDSGVHAEGQVINFLTTRVSMTESNWIGCFNKELPEDIRVLTVEKVDTTFNSRKSAIAREYWYQIVKGHSISALTTRFAINCPLDNLSVEKLQSYTNQFVGVHDFTSFCCATDQNKSKIREIKSIRVEEENGIIIIKILGNSFLYNMIRIIIGTILELIKKNRPPEDVQKIIMTKNRKKAGKTAKAKGLIFKKVFY